MLIVGKFFSERQPKISMEFSNEVSHSINNKPSQFRGDKSKCIIDGMINLTGKGERLGVAKFNCTWGNAAGRVQAKRVDSVRNLLILHTLGLYLYKIIILIPALKTSE